MKLARYIAFRLLGIAVVLLVIAIATYAIFYLLPSDPARFACGRPCTEANLERIRAFLATRERPISQISLHRLTSLQLASTGDLPAALTESTLAVELAARYSRPGDELLALLQRARVRRRLRQVTQARDDLRVAEQLFEEAENEGLRTHLDAAFTKKRKIVSPTQLTAAEGRVAALVREGLSNREIAATLFVSVRTVESHISATLRKTGSSSRSKLIAGD